MAAAELEQTARRHAAAAHRAGEGRTPEREERPEKTEEEQRVTPQVLITSN